MIEELRLSQFQGFSNQTSIPLAPLTLIFGPNSSGKSSVIRSLLLLQQSIQWSGVSTLPEFQFEGPRIDLGSFANVVHKHDQEKQIVFRLTTTPVTANSDSGVVLIDAMELSIGKDSLISGVTVFGSIEIKGGDLELFALEFVPSSGKLDEVESDSQDQQTSPNRWNLTPESELLFRNLARRAPNFSRFPGSAPNGSRALPDFELEEEIERIDKEFGSKFVEKLQVLRAKPLSWRLGAGFAPEMLRQRLDELRPLVKEDARNSMAMLYARMAFRDLQNVADLISSFGSALTRRFHPSRMVHVESMREIPSRLEIGAYRHVGGKSSLERISKWVGHLTKDTYKLEYKPMSGEIADLVGESGTLVLRDKKLDTIVTFQDVGVGLSQVLPVLKALDKVSAIKSGRVREPMTVVGRNVAPSMVLIEQPELHLHPLMQGKLMEVISEFISNSNAPQIIAETHSEAIILKVQAEVAAGKLSADAVSILYVWKDPEFGDSKIKRLALTDRGEFVDPWPQSFAEIRMQQLGGDS